MIGKQIKLLRQEKGFSITDLARLADVSKSYLSQIERGLQTNPSLQFLCKIAKSLDTTIDFLLENENNKQPIPFDFELDDEWKVLFRQAIEAGLKKEDFQEYHNYIKFNAWMKEQNKN